ncbi:MAG TPA: hypothetical protein VNB06_18045 [Thermoanaerobaculia bacterium]|nr:hypothetical protein [Thermoanaerobaculia bacterium]
MEKARVLLLLAAALVVTGGHGQAQEPLSQAEVDASLDQVSLCANSLQVETPSSSRPQMVICTPKGQSGIPYGVAGLPETTSQPPSFIQFLLAPSTQLRRDPAEPIFPTYNLSRNDLTSTIAGSTNDERYVRVTGNPDGQGQRTLLENTAQGKSSETLSGAVMGTYDPVHVKFGPDDRNMHQVFQYVLRGIACDITCEGKDLGDYTTALSVTRDVGIGAYRAEMDVYGSAAGSVIHHGSASARITANVDPNSVVQDGVIELLSSDLAPGIVPEFRILEPRLSGLLSLDHVVAANAIGVPRAVDWRSILAGTPYDATARDVCVSTDARLCLDGASQARQFSVTALFSTTQGNQPSGAAFVNASATGTQWGVLYFFDPNNGEIFVKLLDQCGLPEGNPLRSVWTFVAALTNFALDITIHDYKTGVTKKITNPDRTTAVPVQITSEAAGALPCE